MKTIAVTDFAADVIQSLREPERLERTKASICDVLCTLIAYADERSVEATKDLAVLYDYVELLDALAKQE